LVPVLLKFYIQSVLKLKKNSGAKNVIGVTLLSKFLPEYAEDVNIYICISRRFS